MAIFNTVLTKIFGKKSDKDLKEILPMVDEINAEFSGLESLSDAELKNKFADICNNLKNSIVEEKESLESASLPYEEIDQRLNDIEQAYLDDNMIIVYAIIKDACRRLLGTEYTVMGQSMKWEMVPYDVQLIGSIALHRGRISEMKTGEGKTLVSTMPIILNAMTRRGVHVVTVNDYLAERDSQWMGLLYNYFNLTAGCILNQMTNETRKEMYLRDITYGTNSQFGFDYLRDNMVGSIEQQVQRGHVFAIIDEVDSVLIDEARTPLIISGQVEGSGNQQYKEWNRSVDALIKKQTLLVNEIVAKAEALIDGEDSYELGKLVLTAFRASPKNRRLMKLFQKEGIRQIMQKVESEFIRDKKMAEIDERAYFTIDEKSSISDLMEQGREFLSPQNPENFVIPDITTEYHEIESNQALTAEDRLREKDKIQTLHGERSERIHAINQLLKAYSLFEKDVDYIVQEGKVLIVDEHTGRVLHGRKYSDGLHQALEAKENVTIEKESQTMATITIQNYFRMYEKLAGMTGTAVTEAEEFKQIYDLSVIEIPTNREIQRNDFDDLIYKTKREKYNAVLEKLSELFSKGQPVLVGTTSVEESETLARMLKRKKIPHNVLNAKQHQSEAEIVARAGHKSAITISTNMAGRGTDIKLGDGVGEIGGLFILGTGRHESRRIDLQLRGRSGRQGDMGESVFFLSLEDDLMRIFGSERIAKVMDSLGIQEGEVITHKMVSKSIERAQKKIEARNFGMRKHLLEYDDVLNQQREVVYSRRDSGLGDKDIENEVSTIIDEYLSEALDVYCPTDNSSGWDTESLSIDIIKSMGIDIGSKLNEFNSAAEIKTFLIDQANEMLSYKRTVLEEARYKGFLKFVVFKTIDEKWKEHLYSMDQLREGIGLRSYGQKNPLIEYKREGYQMFLEMMADTNKETVRRILRTSFESTDSTISRSKKSAGLTNMKMTHDNAQGLGFVTPPQEASSGEAPLMRQAPPQRVQPVHADKKIGRNEKVKVQKGEEIKEMKWKKAEKLVESGEWKIVN